MKKSYYIVQVSSISNLIENEFRKINKQPIEGFRTDGQAETHLQKLLHLNEAPFNQSHYSFTIIPFYEKF